MSGGMANIASFKLKNWRILRKTHINRNGESMNLDPLKILILRQINEGQPSRDDGRVAVTFVAAELAVDFVFVHNAIEEMFNSGHIACEQKNLKDKIKRFRLVTLTEQGKNALAEIEAEATVAKFLPNVTAVVKKSSLSDCEKQELIDIIDQLGPNKLLQGMPMSKLTKILANVWAIERAKVPTAI